MKLLGKLAILILVLTTFGMGKPQQPSFVYISFHDKADYNQVYVTDICYYDPNSAECQGGFAKYRIKAEAAFLKYVQTKYGKSIIPNNNFFFTVKTEVPSVEKAQSELATFISIKEKEKQGRKITKTNFTYGCK